MSKTLESNRVVYVYALCCPNTEKVKYVGKTVNIKKRIQQHLSKAKNHPSTHRDYWLLSLGDVQPLLKILEKTTWSKSQESEIYWISKYQDLVNHSLGGEGNLGMILTQSHKDNITAAHLKNSKKVYQYDLKGNYIKTHDNCIKAAQETKLRYGNILQTCRLHKKSHGGFIWSFNLNVNLSDYKHKIKTTVVTNGNFFIKKKRAVVITNIKSNLKTIKNSIKEASTFTNVSKAGICCECKGTRKTKGNYKFEYYENTK